LKKTDYKLNKNRFSIKNTAKLVSFVFDGSVLALPIFLSVYLTETGMLLHTLPSFLISIFFLALIPYMLILILYKCGKICDLHMPRRKERIIPLIFINTIAVSGFFLLWLVPATFLLKTVYTIYIAGLITLSIISLFWKISFHTSYVTIFAIVFLAVYGKWGLFALLLIPLMIWARTELKRHTMAQTVGGVTVTFTVSFIILSINGFTFNDHPAFSEISALIMPAYKYINTVIFPGRINAVLIMLLLIILLSAYKTRLSASLRYSVMY
jgi:hypothetical protein